MHVHSLDIAVQEIDNPRIAQAIRDARWRGVDVDLFLEQDYLRSPLQGRPPKLPTPKAGETPQQALRRVQWDADGSEPCFDMTGGPRVCVSGANNIYHAVRFDALGDIPGIAEAVQSVLTNVYNPTVLVAYRDESDPYPDVWVHDGYFGTYGGAKAWAACLSDNTYAAGGHPNFRCRGQHMNFNSYYNGAACPNCYNTDVARRNAACHELGHTVALRHRGSIGGQSWGKDGCMYPDLGAGAASTLEAESVGRINNAAY